MVTAIDIGCDNGGVVNAVKNIAKSCKIYVCTVRAGVRIFKVSLFQGLFSVALSIGEKRK